MTQVCIFASVHHYNGSNSQDAVEDFGSVNFSCHAWYHFFPHPADPAYKVTLVNAMQWQYYGTPNVAGRLEFTWNSSLISAEKVNIELWGYREFKAKEETNASALLEAELRYLYSLGRNLTNTGAFSFIPEPKEDYSDWELGNIRIYNTYQALDIFTPVIVIYFPSILVFQTDYSCDIERGSVCTYHQGCVHCVRAIHASPIHGSGQQCCYDSTGALVLTGDSVGGSTPDRAHDWGSPPYIKPPRVPGYSHWLYDVMSFYYCCLWSDHCHIYLKRRPSSGCQNYRPPRAGVVLGDPHFITFDGLRYTFNGKGEYYLVSSPEKGLSVQARTEQVKLKNGTLAKATRLSSVAMKQDASDVIEVRVAGAHLQVLRNQNILPFTEQRWMDLHGVYVFSPSPGNVTVIFSSGVGVEVRLYEGTMAVTVLLPGEFYNHTQGLLGSMNSDLSDDLTIQLGEVISSADATLEEIFTFGASWNISKNSSLFTYDSEHLLDMYNIPPSHDPTFVPAFSLPESLDDPLVADMLTMCYGEGSQFCKYDTLTTRDLTVGNATLKAYQKHQALLHALKPVVSCGWLPTPRNGRKNGTDYLEGSTLSFACNKGYIMYGSAERTCLGDGTWAGDQPFCITGFILSRVVLFVFMVRDVEIVDCSLCCLSDR
uniref:Sushi domain containing 2 n=1 Tax=Haplochromis burtoni TaxID=8153 RepID=A0A3Q2W0I2_HAPBU